jgi:hypothetical protein
MKELTYLHLNDTLDLLWLQALFALGIDCRHSVDSLVKFDNSTLSKGHCLKIGRKLCQGERADEDRKEDVYDSPRRSPALNDSGRAERKGKCVGSIDTVSEEG